MALIGEMQYLTIGNNTYSIPASGGSTVQITRNLTSGTKSATITVDGTSYELFAPTVPTNISAFTNDSGYITSADVPEGASAYTGTISAVGTTANTGSNNGFARGDHVHNITKTTIDTTLGTGSGTTKFYREDGTWQVPAYTTNTDTKLQIAAVTSGTTYYPIVAANSTTAATRQYDATGIAYTGTNGTANGSNGNAVLALGNSTASTSANWKKGTVRLYGTTAYYTDLISGAPSGNRTITFPNATGTVALTSDIPTTLPASDVSDWAKASTKPTYTASEVGALASNTTYVSTVTTTAGTHSAITSKSGAVSFNVPTATSHLTNDSGFITSFTDKNVTNTAVTAATTYYLTGSTSSSTATGGLSKHAAVKAYVTANSGTGGSARIDLGNTTATTSAGGKEGIIRLYGTSATYYVDLKAGAPGANRTITFPNKTGTVALTDDIPTVSYPVTSVNSKTGAVSLTASDVGALASTTTYVSTITTSAGTHSTLSSKSGAVSFNVPTKTSHLTNDSGYVTSSGVTSVATGAGLTGGTITGTGTLKANLTSDTALSNAALSVTEDANRIYPVRIDKNSKLVVVVPWTNVNSSYLTGITSSQVTTALGYTPYNSTNPNGYTTNTGTVTKVTAGTGLAIGTTAQGNFTTTGTINHTNSITAQTTQAIYPIKIDAQGHISAYGTAVTIPTKTSQLTNDSGFVTSSGVTGSGTSGYLAKWNGSSTVTNGPQLGSSTTTFLRNDGSWATPSVGVQKTSITVTLTVAGWSDYSQTVTASGVTTSNDVIITPAPESAANYVDAGILCTAQASGSLTFQCSTVPESAVSVNVLILT